MNYKALCQILWKTIKDSFTGKIWRYLIGSSGALLAILLFGKNFLDTTLSVSVKIGIAFLLSLFLIRALLFLGRNIFKYLHNYYRDSKYGDAIILLKEAFSEVHAFRQNDNKSDESFMRTMMYMCNNLQKLFSDKNACTCSVSIKVPIKGALTADTSVMNFCRDSEHTPIRDTPNYKAVNHTIIGNTAFRKVLNNVLRNNSKGFHYLNNNILATKDYDNTSQEVYESNKLPYNSEIVVPIIPTKRDDSKTYETLGFLCVDCISTNKFDEKYDIPLIEGVADGIYDILLINKLNRENHGQQKN